MLWCLWFREPRFFGLPICWEDALVWQARDLLRASSFPGCASIDCSGYQGQGSLDNDAAP